jgi:hypothetical protein
MSSYVQRMIVIRTTLADSTPVDAGNDALGPLEIVPGGVPGRTEPGRDSVVISGLINVLPGYLAEIRLLITRFYPLDNPGLNLGIQKGKYVRDRKLNKWRNIDGVPSWCYVVRLGKAVVAVAGH